MSAARPTASGHQAQDRSEERQHEGLGEELQEDPAPAGAQGRAKRDLALARRASHQQEVGHVGAGDEQQEEHAGQDHQQGAAHALRDVLEEGHDLGAPALVGGGALDGELRGDPRQLVCRLLEGRSGTQARDRGERASPAPGRVAGDQERLPELGLRLREGEGCGHHPDHLAADSVQGDTPSDDPRVGCETALPEAVAQDDDALVARLRLFGTEDATPGRGDAEDLEVLGRDQGRLHRLRVAAGAEAHRRQLLDGGDLLEGARPFAPVEDVPPVHDVARSPRAGFPDAHELLGSPKRQGPQQHRVDDAEDGGARTDAEGQGDDGDRREGQAPPHEAEAVAAVLEQPFQAPAAPHVARHFLDQDLVPELPPNLALGLVGRKPSFFRVAPGHVQVAAKLFRQLLVSRRAPEARQGQASLGRFAGSRIPAIAPLSCSQRDRSDASCLRPAAVSR